MTHLVIQCTTFAVCHHLSGLKPCPVCDDVGWHLLTPEQDLATSAQAIRDARSQRRLTRLTSSQLDTLQAHRDATKS